MWHVLSALPPFPFPCPFPVAWGCFAALPFLFFFLMEMFSESAIARGATVEDDAVFPASSGITRWPCHEGRPGGTTESWMLGIGLDLMALSKMISRPRHQSALGPAK